MTGHQPEIENSIPRCTKACDHCDWSAWHGPLSAVCRLTGRNTGPGGLCEPAILPLLTLADRMATAIERWDDGTGENISALEEAIEAAKAYQKGRVG